MDGRGGAGLRALRWLASAAAGVFGAAGLVLLPYGVEAGRSFQPEPLMVAAVLGATLSAVASAEAPSRRRLAVAAGTGALAVLVKVVAAFFVVPVFAALHLSPHRSGVGTRWRALLAYTAAVFAPAALWQLLGLVVFGFLEGQVGGRVVPRLLGDADFWRAWRDTLDAVVAWPLVAVAVAGGLALGRGRGRAVLGGLVAGYVAHGLVFTYHYATHDYYHLPLLAISALGSGLAAHGLAGLLGPRWRGAVAAAALAVAAVLAVAAPRGRRTVPAGLERRTTAVAREVGALVRHTADAILLAPAEAGPLEYHGRLSGEPWPSSFELFAERFRRQPSPPAAERLADLIAEERPRFFVVTDLDEWARQTDLRNVVEGGYPLVQRGTGFLIFDMRP